MGEKIVVGPINQGLRSDRTPFIIDNDSFPVLVNAYQWRGRIKRKRGTSLLGRLKRFFNSANASYGKISSFSLVSGMGNLLTAFGLQTNGNIVPGSVTLTDSTTGNVFTDDSMGNLVGIPSGTGTINYASGVITIVGGASDVINTVTFNYYPDLPVMGLEDFIGVSTQFPMTIGFDTTYAYNILPTAPYNIYDISFYKNPPTATYPGYIQKSTVTPLKWNGQDYQQFWSTNYQGAFWATNGINVPFNTTNIGMQYSAVTNVAAPIGQTVVITVTGANLVVGDFVFLNEFNTSLITGINFQSGYVIAGSAPGAVTIELPNATLAGTGGVTTQGIVQYLTNNSDNTKDCLRWYDGDPTNGNPTTPILNGNNGWVNFAPPLSNLNFTIDDLPALQYYLVGARLIVPFKDRLLFFGPVVQTSSPNSQVYLQDTVVYSLNGTPYYTASFTGDPTFATTVFNQILVPTNQTAIASAYFEDVTGFGGSISAGIDQPILTASANEDALVVGFSTIQTKLIYSSNDIIPFIFYITNSELGSGSTFSIINMDYGVITRGNRGFIITNQTSAERIDLEIPDAAFQVNLLQNGNERFCSQRDFISEWIYFTYPVNTISYKFPNQTLLYNYRDKSWAIFRECFTTYGTFRKQTGFTWATIGTQYPTWSVWNEPWNSGDSTLLQPDVIGGNQQGFVLVKDEGTGEATSLYIKNISFPSVITGISQAAQAVVTSTNNFVVGQQIQFSGVSGMTQINNLTGIVTAATPTSFTVGINSTGFSPYTSGGTATPLEPIYSPDHCLNRDDYIVISGCLGTISTQTNGNIFSVGITTTNGFTLNPPLSSGFTYLGSGLITRMYVPFIQTKQFPVSWGIGRKTRLGPQQYLLTTTDQSQITLLIYLSQNAQFSYSQGPIIPAPNSINNSLIYSSVLYTCPESTNLGLTPANTNLNLITAEAQSQTWHRINTSLLGDTVQLGFTMSDTQMRDVNFTNQFSEIELHGMILDVTPSQVLA